VINPDCGLRNLTGAVARAKLAAMVAGTAEVRRSLTGTADHDDTASDKDALREGAAP
jgi:5-methyltetrahydropteroyltriglutamate--homocysteine methyltransferase